MTLDTIVVAVGPNDDARTGELIEAVTDVAVPAAATVVLFHAFTEDAYDAGIEEAGFSPDEPPTPDELAARLEGVDAVAAALEEVEVGYTVRGEIGPEADEILRVADEEGADLLYVSGRKRSPTGKAVFGSTVHRLMMNSPCPVLFVREGVYDEGDPL